MSPVTEVSLRLATPDDGAACAAIYRPAVEQSAISFELAPPDGDEMSRRIKQVLKRTPWVIAEVEGKVRGYAYGSRHRERAAYDWTVETTVYVDEAHPRRGIGRACMDGLLDILRLQGFHLAVAGTTLPNDGSVGLHEALGFSRIGAYPAIGYKAGRWYDVAWFALELGPRPEVPVPIRPITELVGSPELERALAREGVPAP
jgi:L-amino acid N-acyltransferase YncA